MKKNAKYHFCRSIRTTQEKRNSSKNGLTIDGFRVKIRAKRSPRQLPDAWDDYFVDVPKCWKDHRKTQYKTDNKYMFGFIPQGEKFKIGNITYTKTEYRWFREENLVTHWYDAVDENGKCVIIDYYDYVEYPIKEQKMEPRKDFILIEVEDPPNETPGGIVLPDPPQGTIGIGLVKAQGPDVKDDLVGKRVVFDNYGIKLVQPDSDRKLVMSNDDDVYAVL